MNPLPWQGLPLPRFWREYGFTGFCICLQQILLYPNSVFVIAVFLTITDEENTETKHALAIRVTVGVLLISAILFIFGQEIFKLLGISVDAFRIGAGALLFLSAISLVDGKIQVPDAKNPYLTWPSFHSRFLLLWAPAR